MEEGQINEENRLYQLYELEACVSWIVSHNLTQVALQFPPDSIREATNIALLLQKKTKCEYYVTTPNMCCVDYTSILHLGQSVIQAIIHFGDVCLSLSPKHHNSIPVLFISINHDKKAIDHVMQSISDHLETKNKLLFLYSTNNISLLPQLEKLIEEKLSKCKYEFAKLNSLTSQWHFIPSYKQFISVDFNKSVESDAIVNDVHCLGPFSFNCELSSYDLVIYLGNCDSLYLKLNCSNLLQVDVANSSSNMISTSKELRKRVSKIEKMKDKSCELIGIVMTHPIPDTNYIFMTSKKLAKRLGKKVYFISMVQTMDEYKLGNFPQLDAFVITNACYCSSVLNAINSNVPIISWQEFEVACGVKMRYGGIDWNTDECQLSEEKLLLEDNLSEMSLVESNSNKQVIDLEVFKKHSWYGLQVNAGQTEVATIKEGQKGRAGGYENEGK